MIFITRTRGVTVVTFIGLWAFRILSQSANQKRTHIIIK